MKIHLIRSSKTIDFEGDNILDCLEKAGEQPDYHCRKGMCGFCRTGKTKGEVEYNYPPLAFETEDKILICCCRPKTDIELDL